MCVSSVTAVSAAWRFDLIDLKRGPVTRLYFRVQYPSVAGKTVWHRVAWGAPSRVSAAARQTA
jgi:hypothetical protein